MLQLHVLDFDLGQGAVIDGELERLAGPKGVDVHPHHVVITDGDDRIAQRFHAFFDLGQW